MSAHSGGAGITPAAGGSVPPCKSAHSGGAGITPAAGGSVQEKERGLKVKMHIQPNRPDQEQ
ncbi:hypothetical protein M513_02398 [Trichuris suis]|uniref:Uncharacterized protein n=1 Tax=Trichuris suis TaxID=68888 RepID=A0A085MHM5_9BILA|nr:hypothetical protein M513_02398 [Trichuris suis]